jgi:antitoxin VapB
MAIHVRDPETDALVRELARRRGIGITEAIREAVDEALKSERAGKTEDDRGVSLRERLKPLLDKVDALPRTGLAADKQFYDELWGQGED